MKLYNHKGYSVISVFNVRDIKMHALLIYCIVSFVIVALKMSIEIR